MLVQLGECRNKSSRGWMVQQTLFKISAGSYQNHMLLSQKLLPTHFLFNPIVVQRVGRVSERLKKKKKGVRGDYCTTRIKIIDLHI